LDAGKHYSEDTAISDSRILVNAAISNLQLDVLDEFNPDERIIEWAAEVI